MAFEIHEFGYSFEIFNEFFREASSNYFEVESSIP